MHPPRASVRRGSVNTTFALIFLSGLFVAHTLCALPQKLGDLDGDGQPTVLDLVILLNHINATPRLSNEMAVFADLNQDGVVNNLDVDMLVDAILWIRPLPDFPLTRILESSPANGDSGVGVMRETIIYFTQPLSASTLITPQNLYAQFGGQKLVTRIELSPDRRKVTLFYVYPLPGSARVRVTFDGNAFTDFAGRPIDADGDGQPGGVAIIDFDTLSQTPLAGTIVCGRVFASLLATPTNGSTNMSINVPLADVTISADGMEQDVRAVTDQFGDFRITNAPGGAFFVHIDGRTVTNLQAGIRWPDMAYYPNVGKRWDSIAEHEVNIGNIYLPLIPAGTLHAVNPTNDTVLTFMPDFIAQHPQFAGVVVRVPPDSLYSDNGTRGGMVGVAPVPPDRLPGPLPPGLYITDVITIQTDGPSNFSEPVPACFPNLPDPSGNKLPPGGKSALWSFNHDTGRFEIVGSGTVTEDGMLVCTDPGVGILAPGWHLFQPGTSGSGGGADGPPPPPPPCDSCECKVGNTKTKPVHLFSGEEFLQESDMLVKGVGFDFTWTRTYGSRLGPNTAQGNGWDFAYNIRIIPEGRGMRVCDGAYRNDLYRPRPDGKWGMNGFFRELEKNLDETLTLTFANQLKWHFYPFDGSGSAGKIRAIVDRNGNTMLFHYDTSGRLDKVTDTLGRDIIITYNTDGFIQTVVDFADRAIRYTYYGQFESGGNFGDLKSVTTPAVTGTPNGNDSPQGKTTFYTYTTGNADDRLNHNLVTITDGRGSNFVRIIYGDTTDPNNINFDRVIAQMWGGNFVGITYVPQTPGLDNNQAVIKTIVNDRVGNVTEYFYDVGNRLVLLREFTGRANAGDFTTEASNRPTGKLRSDDPDFFETRYEYNADFRPTRIIHPNGDITENVYEADLNPNAPPRTRSNLRVVRRLPGTHLPVGDQDLIEESFEYNSDFGCAGCGFNFVTKYTDGRGNITQSQYDERGNLTNRMHQIPSITEQFEYNARGQMTKHIQPDNGNGSRRVDVMNYYEGGPQFGYLRQEISDAPNFALTTTYEYDVVGNLLKKIDPRGHDTQYIVNQLDQIVREISPEVVDGSGIRYTKDFFYDANNNLIRIETQNRVALADGGDIVTANPSWTTTFDYEILNKLIRKSEEVEAGRFRVTEYAYDGNRNRTVARFGEATAGRQTNNVVQMLYDERNLPFREIRGPGSPDQSTTQSDYDGNRNLVRAQQGIEEAPRVTEMMYDSYDRLVQRIDPMDNVSSNNYDPNGNRVAELVSGELVDVPGSGNNVRLSETAFVYDAMNRLIRQEAAFFDIATQAPIGVGKAATSFLYSDTSQILAVTNDNNHVTHTDYDSANRRGVVTDARGNTVTYAYDADSNVTGMTEVEKSDLGGLDESFSTTYGYDNLNRLVTTTDNVGNINRSGYDSRDNRTITIDANTNVIRYAYDGLNRLTQTTREMRDTGSGVPPEEPAIITRQTWDDSSRLTAQIDDNGNPTTYLYDALDRKFATVYADGTGQTNRLDVHWNAVQMADANGNLVTCTYDLNDRLTRKDIVVGPSVAPTTTFEIFSYDGVSRLVLASNDVSLVTRSYDSLSHVLLEVQNGQPVGSIYDGVGNLLQLTYPSGRVITTTYDELERKKTISDENGPIAAYCFVGPNRVARRDYGNGTRATWQYDGVTGTPNPPGDFGVKGIIRTTHTRTNDGAVLDDRTYIWDRMGNKTQRKDVRADGPQLTHDYKYDSIYRLVRSMKTPPVGPAETIVYHLDGVGNRTSVEGGTNAGAYTLDATLPEPADRQVNQYTTTAFDMRRYDKNGNLIAIDSEQPTQRSIAYDYRNQMVRQTNLAAGLATVCAYDATGRRIRKNIIGATQQTNRFFYADWSEVEEQNESAGIQATFVFGTYIDEVVNMRRGVTDSYYSDDQLFNVMAVSDASGVVGERYDYDDYGTPEFFDDAGTHANLEIANPWLFAGHRYDSQTGFYYYRTRFLDPPDGRFTTRDTTDFWGDDRNLGNGFTFVSSNPASNVDPMGLFTGTLPACLCNIQSPPILITCPLKKNKDKWTCTASCHGVQIQPGANCPPFITGTGSGSDENEACRAAKQNANGNVPRGCYKRHCKCDCTKN